MALQAVLESLEGINEALHPEYKKGDDGKYHLELEGLDGHPQLGALYRARDHEKAQKQQYKTEAQEAKAKVDQLTSELEEARKNGSNVDHKSRADDWERKYNKDIADREAKLEEANERLHRVVVEDKAEMLSKEWFTSSALTKGHVKSRLKAEILDNGEVIHRVLDKDGNVTAMSLDDLKKELTANPDFAPVVKAGNGSGSAGEGGDGKGTGGSASDNDKVDLNKETAQEAAARRRAAREAQG